VGNVLDLKPGHGHGVHDLVHGRVGLEVLLQPGEGEFHAGAPPRDRCISWRKAAAPVKPTRWNRQLMKAQLRNGTAPVTFWGPRGWSSRLRGSPMVSPRPQPSNRQSETGNRTAGPSMKQSVKVLPSMIASPRRAASTTSCGSQMWADL